MIDDHFWAWVVGFPATGMNLVICSNQGQIMMGWTGKEINIEKAGISPSRTQPAKQDDNIESGHENENNHDGAD